MDQTQFPMEVIQGVNFLQAFYYFDANDRPIDLTDCTARMQARATVNAEDPPILDWSSETDEIIIDGNAGSVIVSVSAADTADIEQYADAVYDLLLTFPGGFVQQLVSGPISIVGRVTR